MLLDIASHRNDKPSGKIRKKNEQIIISAAEVEFADHGFKGATMNNIALRAGLPKSNLHYYFKNKLQLYIEVLSNILDLWDSTLNELDGNEDPKAALTKYIATKLRFSQKNPLASRIFAKEILSGGPRLVDYFNDGYHEWFERKTAVFKKWMKQNKIDPIDPAHIIFLLWSSTQHYADFSVQIAAAMGKKKLTNKDYEAATVSLTHIIVKGIGVRAS